MKNRIVVKLFLFTSGLCLLILASIYGGQTLLFEDYYASNKIKQLSDAVDEFKMKNRDLNDYTQLQKREMQFYQKNNAWLTVLDENGYVKGTDNFYVEIKDGFLKEKDEVTYTGETVKIPIFYLVNNNQENPFDFTNEKEKNLIEVHGIEKNKQFYPFKVILGTEDSIYERKNPFYILDGGNESESVSYWDNKVLETKVEKIDDNKEIGEQIIYGNIADIHVPDDHFYATAFYNPLFLNQLKDFQTELMLNDTLKSPSNKIERDYEINGISYKVLINKAKDKNGETIYYYVMASLQPVDEAVGMMKKYYIFIIMGVVLLILLAAYYYSKKLASPLLKINDIAKRIANLDFAEQVPIKSNDEIGELSKSINFLSETLYAHINALQQDIEKERQLENTRKSFISGVSHELKTPLSIMKSCIAILEDEIAVEKRKYYFNAMNNEVDRMDRLIIDMLELAKFESGTYKMKMEVFAIDQVLLNVYQQLLIQIRNKNLQINMNLEPKEVVANQHWIEQVVTNFLTNAIRHTPDGGQINIFAVEENDGRVKISIENEGSPIETDQLENLWEQFYQGNLEQYRSKEGTGLGLSIVKNILKLHETDFGVYNTELGVCFYFFLYKE